jgi:hypothetical protein
MSNRRKGDFNEFLQVLQSSETIRTVTRKSQLQLSITEEERALLVETIGRIKDIQILHFFCKAGFLDFHPFHALADAVNNAQSLRCLLVELEGENFSEDSSGLTVLANALREQTALQEVRWFDWFYTLEAAPQDLSPDCVIWALIACPHLEMVTITTTSASADAMKTFTAEEDNLRSSTEHRTLVGGGRRDSTGSLQCQRPLSSYVPQHDSSSESTEAVKAIASAIWFDRHLECLVLEMAYGFTDEAGVALAEV